MQQREEQVLFWKSRARALRKEQEAWRARLPLKFRQVVGKLHVPLLREMLAAACHEDSTFLEDLEHGFPVAGPLHAGGLGEQLDEPRLVHGKPANGVRPDLQVLLAKCAKINERTIARAAPCKQAAAVWAKHKQEILEGKVGKPIRLNAVNIAHVLLVERFGVEENRGGAVKVS